MRRYALVEDLLSRARGVDSLVELVALAARADERAERWAAAEARYRLLLESQSATPALRSAAAVRLARVLESQGRRDSATAAWRRAARALPQIADWFAVRRSEVETDTALAFAALTGARTPGSRIAGELLVARRRAAAGNLRGALEVYLRHGRALEAARVEYAMGQRRSARQRADSLLYADPARPTAFLAATFLTETFDTLASREYLAVSRAYRAHGDRATAERYARRAVERADSSVAAWLELARLVAERRDAQGALALVDSASQRATRRQATLVARGRVEVLVTLDRRGQADSLLETLVRAHRGDSNIARAVLLVADRARARGEADQEARRYRTLLARLPQTAAANVARFRTAMWAYGRGDAEAARALFDDALSRDSVSRIGLPVRYWAARLSFEAGDSAGADALRAIAAEQPLSYYGVRAREVMGDTASLLAQAVVPPPRPGSFAPARARERIRLLASLGLDAEARAEATGWVSDSAASVQLLMSAAQAAAEAGFAREAIALGEAARQRFGLVAGVARALFPLSLRVLIEAEAAEHCVDPLLMAALVRQESRFDPLAVSRVGARGISQVMPATGQQLAARLRLLPWNADDLFVADFNLHLGTRYLADRLWVDSLPVFAALAAYNAGSSRVSRWRRWPEFADQDLFAERVSITETRDYVKTVYASWVWYRHAWRPSIEPVAPVRLVP
jgi:soluble lytic murein transglycosylase